MQMNNTNYWINWINSIDDIKNHYEYLNKHKDKIPDEIWNIISSEKELTEDFIYKYKDYLNWKSISSCQSLSSNFIDKMIDYVYPIYIIETQKEFSEYFLKYHKDNINESNWYNISKLYNFSEKFIIEMIDYININCLFFNENVSNKFIIENFNIFLPCIKERFYSIHNSRRFSNIKFKRKWEKLKKLFYV